MRGCKFQALVRTHSQSNSIHYSSFPRPFLLAACGLQHSPGRTSPRTSRVPTRWQPAKNGLPALGRYYSITRREPRRVNNPLDVFYVRKDGFKLIKEVQTLSNDVREKLKDTKSLDTSLVSAYEALLDLTLKMVAEGDVTELLSKTKNVITFRQQFPDALQSTVEEIQLFTMLPRFTPPRPTILDLAKTSVESFKHAYTTYFKAKEDLGKYHEQIVDMRQNISVQEIAVESAKRQVEVIQTSLRTEIDDTDDMRRNPLTPLQKNESYSGITSGKMKGLYSMLHTWNETDWSLDSQKEELSALEYVFNRQLSHIIEQKDCLERIIAEQLAPMDNNADTWLRPEFRHKFVQATLEILQLAAPSTLVFPYMRGILTLLSWPGMSLDGHSSNTGFSRRNQSNNKQLLERLVQRTKDYQKKVSDSGGLPSAKSPFQRYI